MASGMNSARQQTFTIIGSVAGTVLAATIAIATLIVTQHDAMRRSASEEHASLRGAIVEIRDDIREIRGDIREILSDVSDLRERMARVEVHVGVPDENR